MAKGFSDPAVRAKAQATLAAKAKDMAAAKALAAMAAAQVRPQATVPADDFAMPASLAAELPDVDDLLVRPKARGVDLLDLKLASLRQGGVGSHAARKQVTKEDLSRHGAIKNDVRGAVAGVNVTRDGPDDLIVYDNFGQARVIPGQDFRAVLHTQQAHYQCPLCQGEHLDEDGNVDMHPNACPAREAVKGIRCPVCRQHGRDKVLWDNEIAEAGLRPLADDDDPNIIDAGEMVSTTPEQRLRSKLADHMAAFHPAEGRAMGLDVDRINAQFAQQAAQAQAAFVARTAA